MQLRNRKRKREDPAPPVLAFDGCTLPMEMWDRILTHLFILPAVDEKTHKVLSAHPPLAPLFERHNLLSTGLTYREILVPYFLKFDDASRRNPGPTFTQHVDIRFPVRASQVTYCTESFHTTPGNWNGFEMNAKCTELHLFYTPRGSILLSFKAPYSMLIYGSISHEVVESVRRANRVLPCGMRLQFAPHTDGEKGAVANLLVPRKVAVKTNAGTSEYIVSKTWRVNDGLTRGPVWRAVIHIHDHCRIPARRTHRGPLSLDLLSYINSQ